MGKLTLPARKLHATSHATPYPYPHPHAESMLLYAQDAAEIDEPWTRWEFTDADVTGRSDWLPCSGSHPVWIPMYQYRRISEAPDTIRIGAHEVPRPLRDAPEPGTTVWITTLLDRPPSLTWDGDDTSLALLNLGLLHTTPGAAELHAKALLSFAERES